MIEPKVTVRYALANGKEPYTEWLNKLKDQVARARIRVQVDRLELGHIGGTKSLGEGLFELKMKFGPGYRVYYGYDGPNLIILLAGGDKDSQSKDIKMAKEFWNDYKKTKK